MNYPTENIPIDTGGITQFITGYKEQSPVILLRYRLKEAVDVPRLRGAVQKAVELFSVFRVQLGLDGTIPVYRMNASAPDVYTYDDLPHRYGRESNGYLFRVCYRQDWVFLSIHHMLTDAFGAHEFMKCILLFYTDCADAETIRTLLLVDADDFRDPFLMYGDANAPSISMQAKWKNELILPDGMHFRKNDPVRVSKLRFDLSDFLRISRRTESSVLPLLTWLSGMAVAAAYDGNGKMIVGSSAFNCRGLFGSRTAKPFSKSFVTVSHPREAQMDFDLQLTVHRARMDIELERDTVARSLAEQSEAAGKLVRAFRTSVFDQERLDAQRFASAQKRCYFLSYLGHFEPGPVLEQAVEDFDFTFAVTRNPINLVGYERHGTLFLAIHEIGCETGLADAFLGAAETLGIAGQLEGSHEQMFDSFPMGELFRGP